MAHQLDTLDFNRNTSVSFYIVEVTSRNVHVSHWISYSNADSDSVGLGCDLKVLHFSQTPK